MLELLQTIFGFLVNVLPLAVLEGIVIVVTAIYVLYLFSRQKILEEKIALYENRIEQLNNEVTYLTSLRTQAGVGSSTEDERLKTPDLAASVDGPIVASRLPPGIGTEAEFPPSTDVDQLIAALKQEIQQLSLLCRTYKVIDEPRIWESLCRESWFIKLQRASCLRETQTFFTLILSYKQLPRARGQGYQIEDWVRVNQPQEQANRAIEELDGIKLRVQLG